MDVYSVGYSAEALQDLRDIFDYISRELKEHSIAVAQLKRIRDEIRSLDMFPKRNKAVEWEPWATRGMRQMPVDHFIVFYIVNDVGHAVQVVRIFYGKRDIPTIVSAAQ